MRTPNRLMWIGLFLLSQVVACGGGGDGGENGGGDPPPPPQLVFVAVSPSNPVIPLGTTQQFVATGTYSDGTSQDVTVHASWSSSNIAVVQVNDQGSKGLASSVAVGVTTIAASMNGIAGIAELTVSPAALISIEIALPTNVSPPATGQIAIAATQQYIAVGQYTDNSIHDITTSVTWSSSDSTVAVISNAQGEKGLASGIAVGTVTIGATLSSIYGTTNLVILPIKALDLTKAAGLVAGLAGVEIDENGNALAAWNYQFTGTNFGIPPELYTASYTSVGGWTQKTPIDMGGIDDFPAGPSLAMNASGVALLAWTGNGGVYASKYTPGLGWQQARVVASGASPFLTFAGNLRIAIDVSGNGLLVWTNDNGDKLFSSLYQQGTDTWTVPQELPNVNRGFARSALALAMNASGYGVVLWENWDFGATPGWTLYASLFVPGTGQGTGWQTPQSLYQSGSGQTPTAAINDKGEIVAVWVDYVSNFPNTSLYTKRYIPNQGWQAQEGISVNDINRPSYPRVAMNNAGTAVVVWYNSFDYEVRASRFITNSGWQTPETLWPPCESCGDPTVLQPHITQDGRILAAWVTADINAPFKVGLRRYVSGNGWDDAQGLPYIEHKGQFSGINIAFNPSGTGVAFWSESYDIFDGQFLNSFSDFYVNTQLSY